MYIYRGQWHGDVAIKMLHMDPDTDNAAQLSAFKLEVKYIILSHDVTCFFSLYFFSVRLLSVLRGHSFYSSPPQRPMTFDYEGFSIPDFILILEKEPVFSLFNVEC